MAVRHRPTDDDRHRAIDLALSGLARGDDLGDIAARLEPLHPPHNTFPAELLLDLAADAIGIFGASRRSPIEFEGIRARHLPEGLAHTKAPAPQEQVHAARRGDAAGWRRPRTA